MDSPSASMWAVQPTAFRLVAAIANWVASQHDPVYHGCDQLQVTCLRRNTVSCDEVRFCDIIVHLSIFNSEIMTRIKRTETPTDGVNELGVPPVCYNSLPNKRKFQSLMVSLQHHIIRIPFVVVGLATGSYSTCRNLFHKSQNLAS